MKVAPLMVWKQQQETKVIVMKMSGMEVIRMERKKVVKVINTRTKNQQINKHEVQDGIN